MAIQTKTIQTTGFFILLLLFFILVMVMFRPFFQLLALAGILAFLFLPLHTFFVQKLKHESLAAMLTVICILTIVLVPLYFLTQAAVTELIGFYGHYTQGTTASGQLAISQLPAAWQATAQHLINDAWIRMSAWAQSLSSDIAGILSNIAGFLFSFFLLFFSIYYFLKDHRAIKEYLGGLLPLSSSERHLLMDKLISALNGVVRGNFLMALLQGLAATFGYFLAGVPQPLIWGLVTAICSFIPNIGIFLVIIPAIIYLLLFNSLSAAIILTVWMVIIHLPLGNILGPKLIGSRAQLPPLLLLLSVLGGLTLFGFLGFLFGPVIVAIFMALLDEYRGGYQNLQS